LNIKYPKVLENENLLFYKTDQDNRILKKWKQYPEKKNVTSLTSAKTLPFKCKTLREYLNC